MTPQQAIAQLQQVAKQSREAMRKAEFTVVNTIATDAISLAPEDTGALIESIRVGQDATGSEVVVEAPYSGWVEFGTAGIATKTYLTSLPQDQQEEAQKFFVSGKGSNPPQGPRPFFFPSVLAHQEDIYVELDKELAKLAE